MATWRLAAMMGDQERTSDGAVDSDSDDGLEALSASPKGNGRLYCGAQREAFHEIDMTRNETKSR